MSKISHLGDVLFRDQDVARRQIAVFVPKGQTRTRPEESEEIYRWLYDNLDIISKDEEAQDKAVLIIKQGLVDHSFVADPEINLASVMIKLARLK